MSIHHRIILTALVLAIAVRPVSAQSSTKGDTLTNRSVIDMVAAKLPRALIVAKLTSTPAQFDVTATGLVSLVAANVPTDYIKMMMDNPQGSATPKGSIEVSPEPASSDNATSGGAPPQAGPAKRATPPLSQNCKPDPSVADKITKERPMVWSQALYSPGMNNNGDISQVDITGSMGTNGIINAVNVRIHRNEVPSMRQGYEARKGDIFYLGMKDGSPLEFKATIVDNDITMNMNSGKLVTNIELSASLSDKELATLRDALTTRQIDAVRIYLERGVVIEQSIKDKNSKGLMEKFSCFYQAFDNTRASAGDASPDVATRLLGTYVQRDTASTRIEFRPGGTSHLTLASAQYEGYYRVRSDTITIQFPGASSTRLTLSGNTLVGLDGTVFEKPVEAKKVAPATPMTNKQVIDMVAARVPEAQIIAAIRRSTGSKFDLTTAGVAGLRKSGVSDAVIRAMRPQDE